MSNSLVYSNMVDAAGSIDATGAGAQVMTYTATEPTVINRMICHIEDSGAFTAEGYGSEGALSTGITIETYSLEDAAVITTIVGTDHTIQSNGDWGAYCYDYALVSFGAGINFSNARFTFSETGRILVLKPNEQLRVNVPDDTSGLIEHRFNVQGFKLNSSII